MDESDLIRLIKLSIPALLIIIVVLIVLMLIRAKLASDSARQTEMDHDRLRLEMESLAREKIASRKSSESGSELQKKTSEGMEVSKQGPETQTKEVEEESSTETDEGHIEGEPLA